MGLAIAIFVIVVPAFIYPSLSVLVRLLSLAYFVTAALWFGVSRRSRSTSKPL
jgi:hypothetical protein